MEAQMTLFRIGRLFALLGCALILAGCEPPLRADGAWEKSLKTGRTEPFVKLVAYSVETNEKQNHYIIKRCFHCPWHFGQKVGGQWRIVMSKKYAIKGYKGPIPANQILTYQPYLKTNLATDASGLWRTNFFGNLVRVTVRGAEYNGRIVGTSKKGASAGYFIGEIVWRGTVSGRQYRGHTKLAFTTYKSRRACSLVNRPWAPVELTLSKDGETLTGRVHRTTYRIDRTGWCRRTGRKWGPMTYKKVVQRPKSGFLR
jgi:hypothetical protein